MNDVGIAYLPDFSVKEHIAHGRLQPVLDDYAIYSNSFHLLWTGGRHPPPKLRAFINHVSAARPLNP